MNVFQIPPGSPFALTVTASIKAKFASRKDPLALSRIRIFVPTRRAQRALLEAFGQDAGVATLCPHISALADMGRDLPAAARLKPAIAPMHRQLLLARLIRGFMQNRHDRAPESMLAGLAEQLMRLMDDFEAAHIPLSELTKLTPEDQDLAAHWQDTLDFLQIALEHWPQILEAEGCLDPEHRRRLVVEAQISDWAVRPPVDPVIIAGDVGDTTTTLELMSAVAGLEAGMLILPALDTTLTAQTWHTLPGRYWEHPFHNSARLLERLKIARKDVPFLGPEPTPEMQGRRLFLSHALRPPPVTDVWRERRKSIARTAHDGLKRVSLVEADTPHEEALAIALAMREALETPTRTVALMTPDRKLARRVSAHLTRWNIYADDSGGRPLALTPPGVYLNQVARAFMGPQAFDPENLTGLLKHPLSMAGGDRARHLHLARRFEAVALRGPRPATGFEGLRTALHADEGKCSHSTRKQLDAWLDQIEAACAPLCTLNTTEPQPLEALFAAHQAAAEGLTGTTDEETSPLWAQAAGETAAQFFAEARLHAAPFGPLAPAAYPSLFETLMRPYSVRAPYGLHPRVFIWGEVEGRSQAADITILGGLNEGVWPRLPTPDPWVSRSMRRALKLPALEQRIGLSAHDFLQAASAGEVILTRSQKIDGAPTVASRWLLRIATLLGEGEKTGVAPGVLRDMRERGAKYLNWARQMTDPPEAPAPAARPYPTPPVAARPLSLSCTGVERLVSDPYEIYAKKILKLYPLDAIGITPDYRDRGNLLHLVLEQFLAATLEDYPPPEEAEALLRHLTDQALAAYADWPLLEAFWRDLLNRMSPWFLHEEAERRRLGTPFPPEIEGRMRLEVAGDAGARSFTLTARADRIDKRPGGLVIMDYKSGTPPSKNRIIAPSSPAKQMALEGAIALAGGFEGIEETRLQSLLVLALKTQNTVQVDDAAPLAEETARRLAQLISAYEHEAQGYLSEARPYDLRGSSDYAHLARTDEWGLETEATDGGK